MPEIRPTETRTHARMHARDRCISRSITGTLRRSLVPFSGLRSFGAGGQVRATTPSIPTRPFLFLWEKKSKREGSHDPTVQTQPQASRFKSDRKVYRFYMRVGAPVLVCVRRLVRRWNAPVHPSTRPLGRMALSSRSDVSFREPCGRAGAVSVLYPETSGRRSPRIRTNLP